MMMIESTYRSYYFIRFTGSDGCVYRAESIAEWEEQARLVNADHGVLIRVDRTERGTDAKPMITVGVLSPSTPKRVWIFNMADRTKDVVFTIGTAVELNNIDRQFLEHGWTVENHDREVFYYEGEECRACISPIQ